MLTYAGDAYFIADPDKCALSLEKKTRLGFGLIALGFWSTGINLISLNQKFTKNKWQCTA